VERSREGHHWGGKYHLLYAFDGGLVQAWRLQRPLRIPHYWWGMSVDRAFDTHSFLACAQASHPCGRSEAAAGHYLLWQLRADGLLSINVWAPAWRWLRQDHAYDPVQNAPQDPCFPIRAVLRRRHYRSHLYWNPRCSPADCKPILGIRQQNYLLWHHGLRGTIWQQVQVQHGRGRLHTNFGRLPRT